MVCIAVSAVRLTQDLNYESMGWIFDNDMLAKYGGWKNGSSLSTAEDSFRYTISGLVQSPDMFVVSPRRRGC